MAAVNWRSHEGAGPTYDRAHEAVEPKVPVLYGTGGYVEVKAWIRSAEAFALSLADKQQTAGNRLLLNLRGDAARLAEEIEPSTLVDDEDT